jgi:hypothetical protein
MVSSFNSATNTWDIGGSGVAYITDSTTSANVKDPTVGTWNLHAGAQGSAFVFGSSTTVPDSGTTILLMVIGLSAIAFTARRTKLVKA